MRSVVGHVLEFESMRDPATEIIARMTPAQKLEASMRLYWSARKLKAAGIRAEHPDWSEAEVAAAVRAAFLFHHE
jgi:hypothetical protein